MRIFVKNLAVLEGTRLGFVGVADQIDGFAALAIDEGPLQAAGEARATATAGGAVVFAGFTVVIALCSLAFAGIPLTSGFVSKFAVFKAAGEGGAIPLVIVGVIASAIAAYFYVRVIVLMFFTDPPDDAPDVVAPSILSTAVVTITAAVTFALGALPQPLLDLANIADQFLR